MTKPWRPQSNVVPFKRLRSLEEFKSPKFVGWMARAARAQKRAWWSLLAAAIITGLIIGLLI